ncbi:Sn1-specific diacylglycerol lipase alpha [Quillaja saponaria]|uniref:Sn1-specific diacylglycerol lipase alpha n=1 Tax=Quillaja saponaria TaxID=32244 RepID=A0AAD7Q0M2_QUISA|nr:Sn1-specific diacylglycerol lipase alpha [Quillaja saponaria]
MPNKAKDTPQFSSRSNVEKKIDNVSGLRKYSSDDEDITNSKWKLELDWLTKALEPALQLCRWALPTGDGDWSLSDLTIGLYLMYLRRSSTNPFEDIKGNQISSESIVQHLIYHTELANGAYKENAAGLARNSMLRESDVLKFVRSSSVMRPGYFIGIDTRKKLKYERFRLRLVGHSLGGAIASLLAIMIHRKSLKELGFSPDIVSAVGYGTPPCVSKELAESCSDYVTTVVMQDDIIPRLNVASLTALRNEILQTDWMSFRRNKDSSNGFLGKKPPVSPVAPQTSEADKDNSVVMKSEETTCTVSGELFIPGTVYYLRRNLSTHTSGAKEYFTLWKRHPSEHFQKIILSNNLISDHKCDSHYHALRYVLNGSPWSGEEGIFK